MSHGLMNFEIFENPTKIARPDFADTVNSLSNNDLLWAISERQKSLTDNIGSYKKRSLTYQLN